MAQDNKIQKSFLTLRNEVSDIISIEDYNKELDAAEAEFENGHYITHEEMIKKIRQPNTQF